MYTLHNGVTDILADVSYGRKGNSNVSKPSSLAQMYPNLDYSCFFSVFLAYSGILLRLSYYLFFLNSFSLIHPPLHRMALWSVRISPWVPCAQAPGKETIDVFPLS
jgi:hypothetical protein